MPLYTSHLSNAVAICGVSGSSSYGIGILTAIGNWFCNFFGAESYTHIKVGKAADLATKRMMNIAAQKSADGIMDIRYEVSGTTVFVYGTAFTIQK